MSTEHDHRLLVHAAPDGVVVSHRGVVRYANPAALRLLGYERAEDLVGKSMATFLSPEDMVIMRERIGAIAAGAVLPPKTYKATRCDGGEVAAEITSLPMKWEGEDAVVAFARDVTERTRLEAQLARAERLAAVGTLASGIAHEINNPLAFALLGVERLRRILAHSLPPNEARDELADVLSDVKSGMERAASIVRDLQVFTRDEAPTTAQADVLTVIESVRKLTAHRVEPIARLNVRLSGLPRVRIDPLRLEQVLANLIVNGVESFVGSSPTNFISIDGEVGGTGKVVIRVVDNGAGMAPDVLTHVFDPFFTTKHGAGTGLGLWLCHAMVSHARGTIHLSSELGAGTTVTLELPIGDNETSSLDEGGLDAARPRARKFAVLVIDDEPALLRSVEALLSDDYAVEVATSGTTGLDRLLTGPRPDVILCDLSMPGLTGEDVFERITAQLPGLERRIVFMTGGAFTPAARAFLARMTNPHIEKPFSYAALDRVLRAIAEREC